MGDTDLSLVVLAAGVGSRYGGLKQLDGIGPEGETLMEYSIYDAVRAGVGRVVLVVRPETEADFRRSLGGRIGSRIHIEYVHQTLDDLPPGWSPPDNREKPWGTGQAVLAARDSVAGAFIVVNADDFYGAESFLNLSDFLVSPDQRRAAEFALQGFEIGPTLSAAGSVSRGLCRVDQDDHLESIVEILEVFKDGDGGRFRDGSGTTVRLAGHEPVSMNMWGFTPAVFGELNRGFAKFLAEHHAAPKSEFQLPALVQQLIGDGRARVKVLRDSGRWCGMTYAEDRDRAARAVASLVSSGVYPSDLWGGDIARS